MHTPKLRHHKPSGRALVEIKGRRYYLGKYGSPEATEAYFRLLAEVAANGCPLPKTGQTDLMVIELTAAYWDYAKLYYRHPDGTPTQQLSRIKPALAMLNKLYGQTPAVDFGPRALTVVRQAWVDEEYARVTCNAMTACVKRAFKWAAAQELIPGSVFANLSTLDGLKRGRTKAREMDPIQPADLEAVEAVKPYLSRQIVAMIDLQLLTAARPGEIVLLRPCDIDQSGDVWTATLSRHKTAYCGRARTLYFGPRAQAVLRPFMLRDPDAPMFNPLEAVREKYAQCENHRHQAVEQPRTNRKIRDRYDTGSYARAIARACGQVNKKRETRGLPALAPWSPNQLRHTAATEIRHAYGLEAAQVLLGHASADITQIYAETDKQRALEIVRCRG